MCDRAAASPHRSRTDEDREMLGGIVPTILVLYDDEAEAISAIAFASKAVPIPWRVESFKNVMYELGYGELKIAIKYDGAKT